MKFARTTAGKLLLAVLVFAPVAIAAAAMLWTNATMLNGIADSVNRQETERARQAVRSAFEAMGGSLENTVRDNANWDDAATNSYGVPNQQWLADNFGVGTSQGLYDKMFLVTKDGATLSAFSNGSASNFTARQYLGPLLDNALKSLYPISVEPESRNSIAWTPTGLALMAIAAVRPSSAEMDFPKADPRFIVFVREVDSQSLIKMGEAYIVDSLRVVMSPHDTGGDLVLKDRWGSVVTSVAWADRRPGDLAQSSYRHNAQMTIVALFLALVPVCGALGYTLLLMRKNEEEALLSARSDSLSGLPNRLGFREQLDEQCSSCGKGELALLFIDLDGFKAVNDAFDHGTGDRLIRAIAAGINSIVSPDDMLARVGGDEFAVLMCGPAAEERAMETAGRIHAFVSEPFEFDGRIAAVGASIGIALKDADCIEPAELMRRADIAMYDAKESGRNRSRRFSPDLDRRRKEDQTIADDLRAFLAEGIVKIAYQPVVDAKTRAILGLEVLARWPGPDNKSVGPDRFIRVAEEHGLIDRLSDLVMSNAFREARRWPAIKLAFNISPTQIKSRNLPGRIAEIATRHGFAVERLELEITENVLIGTQRKAADVIAQLRELGAEVVLDDFGAGFASAGHLRQYAFSSVKIDKTLTQAVLHSEAAQKIVQGAILMAQGLSTEIVAEGIETEEQAAIMHLAGCRRLQGYLFGVPMPGSAVDKLLAAQLPMQLSIAG
jgi:diguanylate cyclase (GGDEF)-like protein